MVAVWNPTRGSVIHFDPAARTGRAFVCDVALGGNTLAWVNAPATGAYETPLLVERARLDQPFSPPVVAEFTHSADPGDGNLLGDLHSGGAVVAFDTYYLCVYGDGLDCLPGYAEYATYGEQVWLLDVGTPGACASIPTRADPSGGDITFERDPSVLPRKGERCEACAPTPSRARPVAESWLRRLAGSIWSSLIIGNALIRGFRSGNRWAL
jgi:hypothetical protein